MRILVGCLSILCLSYVLSLTYKEEQSNLSLESFIEYMKKQYPEHYTFLYSENFDINDSWDSNWNKLSTSKTITDFKDLYVNNNETIPSFYKTEAKLAWDKNYIYILAKLYDPLISIQNNITGHNTYNQPPYLDNDFELFFDPSRTGLYYKEFEMNGNNATYDVNWGMPDGDVAFDGLCYEIQGDSSYLPYNSLAQTFQPFCQNTTYRPAYNGSWTMYSIDKLNVGLQTKAYRHDIHETVYFHARDYWRVQVAMPIHSSSYHGGLMDTIQGNMFPEIIDPAYTTNHQNGHIYWNFDVSRAVHPKAINQVCPNPNGMIVNMSRYSTEACVLYDDSTPLPQTWKLMTNDSTDISQDFLQVLFEFNEGLLGVDSWNNYWEWAWQSLPKPYMHVPYSWAIGEFVHNNNSTNDCKDEFFYGRLISTSIFYSLANYTSTNTLPISNYYDLLMYCGLQCDIPTLVGCFNFSEIFDLSIHGDNNWWYFDLGVKYGGSSYSVTMTRYGNMTTSPPLPQHCLF